MFRRSLILMICMAGLMTGSTGCVYYNTFYNTKKEFNQAEKYRKQTGVGSQAGYKNAIDKALKIIENHPNSKYYDDALYVLAVSYFYTGQHPRAERRFRELMANYPDSKYSRQSMIYLAQSKLKIDEHEEAIQIFEEIFAGDFDKQYKAEAAMELGLFHMEEKEFTRARAYFQSVRDSLGNDQSKIKAQSHIADSYFDAFDFDDALSGYLQILGMKPDKNLKYHALNNAAICSYRLQRIEAGLGYLDELAKDQLYYDSLGAIKLTQAMGYEYLGELLQAEDLYSDVAAKSGNSTWITEANYQLGLIYQFDYDDLPTAKEYYDKAIRGNQSSESGKDAVQRSADIAKLQMIEARQRSAKEDEEKRLRGEVVASDTAKALPDTTRKMTDRARRGERDDTRVGGRPADSAALVTDTAAARVAAISEQDTITVNDTAATKPVDNLALSLDSTRIDSTFIATDTTRSDSTLAVSPVDSTGADSLFVNVADSTKPDTLSATLPNTGLTGAPPTGPGADTLAPKIDSAAIERKRLAKLESDADVIFQLAELFWFQLNKPDSAIAELKGLIANYPTTSYAPRAMLALSSMYREHLSDTAGADSILQEAYAQYAHTDYAPEIFRALDLKATPADTGYPEYYFRLAEDFLIDSNNVDSAKYYYQYVVDSFPTSRFALQARFNTVWIVENYQHPGDSSVIFAYEQIIDSFPGTDQANAAEKRLSYTPPKKRTYIVKAADQKDDTISTKELGDVITVAPKATDDQDTIGRYIDPKERIYKGPKGEPLILLDIRPIETRVDFEYPPEASSVEGYQFEVYFQILLDFSGRVADYVLKSPAPHDEINRRVEKTVASMSFDPLEVNRELTRKSEMVTLPEDQEDERGRWYVYKFIVEKPDYLK
ncbi:MAG: tetratricopeptide repeat protein [candidate division Zixibacteria bacterium]|nr:tetratricopeptide repeat protein [candidate division Zixibacteria bacterium]